jgi:hypothetical protein
MKRRLFVVVALLLCIASVGVFAEQKSSAVPWWVSFGEPGKIDATVGVGWTEYGFGVDAGANFTFGEFALGPFPLSWGATALATFGFTSGMGIGAGAFIDLETGLDFGDIWKFDWRGGIGPAIGLGIGAYQSGFGLGIGSYSDFTWLFSDNMGVIAQYAYMWSFFGPGMYAYTLGVQFKF